MNVGNVQKGNHGVSIFMGDAAWAARAERNSPANGKEKKSGNSIYAGDLNMAQDNVAMKRQQARRKAMKVLTDAFAGEQEIDGTIAEQKAKVEEMKEEYRQNSDDLKSIREAKSLFMEEHGITDETKEIPEGLQEEWKFYTDAEEELTRRMTALEEGTAVLNKGVEDIMVARLKEHPMVDAQKESDEIMEAASKEIIGALIDEAKDHIDEKLDEAKEKAEEEKEKEEEEAERIAASKEKSQEEKAAAEAAKTLEQVLETDQSQGKVQKELQGIADAQKLLEEDIKGILLDHQV